MSVIRWEKPPRNGAGRPRGGKWRTIAGELRSHPGQWALVYEGTISAAGSLAYGIRTGKLGGIGDGPYEAVSRSDGDKARVYARYVGEVGA